MPTSKITVYRYQKPAKILKYLLNLPELQIWALQNHSTPIQME